MVAAVGGAGADALVTQIRDRFGYTILAANFVGGLVVFLFGNYVLPGPPGLHHTKRLLELNLIVFAVLSAVTFPLVFTWSRRRSRLALGWAIAGRSPTDAERESTLRLPLRQQAIVARIWTTAAIVFFALNAPFSLELGVNVAVTIVLGGLVTCALGYLLGERRIRPIIAMTLASGVPTRPQLPGVAARALLSWTLSTGAVLLGLALIAIGGLHEAGFDRQRLLLAILVLSLIGLVVGLMATVSLARSLADPIESLRHALGRVELGDLDQQVAVDDGSEVGLLQAGFNRMVVGLRERERIRDLFGRQVGEDVVRHALEHGVTLGGEAREAAVLFVDLQGSTTLAEKRDPAEVVGILNAFFAIVVEVVAAHDGWVNKFEGDAALCVFGAPLPDPEAASRALAAARSLRDRLAMELDGINAGIGVSAGRVVAGNIGVAKRFEYTVIGDPVNEAARLTELAKARPERLLVSEAALSRADGAEAAQWRVCDELRLRGRSSTTSVAAPHSR